LTDPSERQAAGRGDEGTVVYARGYRDEARRGRVRRKNILSGAPGGAGRFLVAAPEKARLRLRLPRARARDRRFSDAARHYRREIRQILNRPTPDIGPRAAVPPLRYHFTPHPRWNPCK